MRVATLDMRHSTITTSQTRHAKAILQREWRCALFQILCPIKSDYDLSTCVACTLVAHRQNIAVLKGSMGARRAKTAVRKATGTTGAASAAFLSLAPGHRDFPLRA